MRRISSEFAQHLKQSTTTLCRCLRITLANGQTICTTSLDKDLEFLGSVFKATIGLDISIIATDASLSVDNSEASGLFNTAANMISYDEVRAGALDNATYELFLVNWQNLNAWHRLDAGDIGEVTLDKQGQSFRAELLSFIARMRQPLGSVWSRKCRAIFGSSADSPKGCGVNASTLWKTGEVTGVGEENDRVFADQNLPFATPLAVARLRWLTGKNAAMSKVYQVEGYSHISGTIALIEPTPYPVQQGDTFEIRPDCAKNIEACKAWNNFINYKGEPYIPVESAGSVLTPGAGVSGGLMGGAIED